MRITLFLSIIILIGACAPQNNYIKNEGFVFGTMYHYTYQSEDGKSYETEIQEALSAFNSSLSTYDNNSIISKVNQNYADVELDSFFIACFKKGKEISETTNGAFDMTVAPVVNAWGFGFENLQNTDSTKIDSLMQFVGFNKVHLKNNRLVKDIPGIMLDASAIAKGYGVDIAAQILEQKGIDNYMVEIGGEVRARGVNPSGNYWRIGVDKPIEDETARHRELQAIIPLKNKSMATSGNYRQFYEKDGVKYSHTIDPKTGFPARHSLLSATVVANECMTADGFATAFMVMGVKKSIEITEKLNYLECYLIYTDSTNQFQTYASPGLQKHLNKVH